MRIATPFFSQIVISIIFDNESSPDTWLGVYLKTNIKDMRLTYVNHHRLHSQHNLGGIYVTTSSTNFYND